MVADSDEALAEEQFTSNRRRKRQTEEIDMDITPMIDMVFLLLIFFLVSSTPDQQTSILLPEAQHGVAVTQNDAVIFTIGEGGLNIAPAYAADGRIPGTELPDNLEVRNTRVREIVERGFQDNKTQVVIKADKNVAHREVANFVKAASQVQGMKLHLAVMDSE